MIRKRAKAILERLEMDDGQSVPADLVTASGGGLDPHISYAAAMHQARRIAKARGIGENIVKKLVDDRTEQIPLTFDEASRIVNVLELNVALDRASDNQ
jgi:K+-transporting ATPase ATPase C chain